MTFPNIVDLIGITVAQCREVGQDAPYYYFGHPLEIVNTLMEKDKNSVWKLKKYPAIFLFHDFEETRDKFISETELRIIIVTETRPEWKAADRYTNVFVPTLIPIYDKLIHELSHTANLTFSSEHKMKIYPFWGSEANANVANDCADAIVISGCKVKTYASCTPLASGSNPTFDSTYISMDSVAYEFSNQ
jgi:hypothetical protein